MAEKTEPDQPTKKQKVDEEYEPQGEEDSGSSDLEVYSDELNPEEPEIDINEYLKQRQRIIEEENAEESAGESSESESSSSPAEEPPQRRSKRRRPSSDSSSSS